jgi:sec-independent protein translocase protein TatA
MLTDAIAGLGTTELLIILAVIILLFGAAKLPELARGSGRALRIFKAETKGLTDDDEPEDTRTVEQRELEARRTTDDQPLRSEGDVSPQRRDDTTA